MTNIKRLRTNREGGDDPTLISWLLCGVVACAAVFLLVAHTLMWHHIAVDTTSLGLLALLLVVPLAPYITSLKAGGVEVGIRRRYARRLREVAAELPGTEDAHRFTPSRHRLSSSLWSGILHWALPDSVWTSSSSYADYGTKPT